MSCVIPDFINSHIIYDRDFSHDSEYVNNIDDALTALINIIDITYKNKKLNKECISMMDNLKFIRYITRNDLYEINNLYDRELVAKKIRQIIDTILQDLESVVVMIFNRVVQ